MDAIVEGVGDHGCEYMTGGRVVVLGPVGKNFAAGMSGGTAYVYTENIQELQKHCNQELVEIEALEDGLEQEEVNLLVLNYFRYTSSLRAFDILQNWNGSLSKWVKIIPREYKQIVKETLKDELRVES